MLSFDNIRIDKVYKIVIIYQLSVVTNWIINIITNNTKHTVQYNSNDTFLRYGIKDNIEKDSNKNTTPVTIFEITESELTW